MVISITLNQFMLKIVAIINKNGNAESNMYCYENRDLFIKLIRDYLLIDYINDPHTNIDIYKLKQLRESTYQRAEFLLTSYMASNQDE